MNEEVTTQTRNKKGLYMDRIKIEDSRFLIKSACQDLKSLSSVMEAVVDQTDCLNEQDLLAVTIRALKPIIDDLQKATNLIDEELELQEHKEKLN